MPFGAAAAIAGIGTVANIGGSLLAGSASKSAASTEAGYSQQAAANQQNEFNTNQNYQNPYIQAGTNDLSAYQNQYQNTNSALTGAFNKAQALSTPGTMTQAQLEATPGYQFSLNQGLQATQANAASRGLGVSGAAMKGATNYATGLASNTYQNVFNQQQQQYQNANQQFSNQYNQQSLIGNQLQGVVGMGENAASNLGSTNTTGANYYGQDMIGQGQQYGAGITGQASNYANALNSLGQAPMVYNGINNMMKNNSSGNSGVTGYTSAAF